MNLDPPTGPRVLIVEDEHDNREIMRAVVEDLLGYTALLATNGEEALHLARQMQPNVILMDLMMPVLDGFDAIKQLKGSEQTAAIPVVAVTALSRPTDRERAVESGADGYLSKPFDLDLMAQILENYITNDPAAVISPMMLEYAPENRLTGL